jgi:hypothetical protein
MTVLEPPAPQPGEPGPLFWLGARALTHVGEFRRYYALLAIWAIVMLVVPRTGLPVDPFAGATGAGAAGPAATSSARRAPESAAAAALVRPSSGAATFFSDPVLDAFTGPSTFGEGASSGGFAAPGAGSGTGSSFDVEPEPEPDPEPQPPAEDALPVDIPPPPPLPLPAPPPELEPLLAVVSPLANTACSPVGLAGVVVALVGPSVSQVPVTQIVPYLTPLYVACGSFPQVGPRTVCEIDEVYVSQDPTGGLLPPPAVVGLGIDTIEQLEKALGGLTNQAAMLRQQLNCRKG